MQKLCRMLHRVYFPPLPPPPQTESGLAECGRAQKAGLGGFQSQGGDETLTTPSGERVR